MKHKDMNKLLLQYVLAVAYSQSHFEIGYAGGYEKFSDNCVLKLLWQSAIVLTSRKM